MGIFGVDAGDLDVGVVDMDLILLAIADRASGACGTAAWLARSLVLAKFPRFRECAGGRW
jgi:hypothetical protein